MSSGRYRIVSFGQQVDIGVTGSQYVQLSAVAKTNSAAVPYCIPNELICAEIGRFLCLPVPPAAVIHAPGAPSSDWFASLDFNLTGNSLPPIDPAECYSCLPSPITGTVLFDVLIANPDRNRGNLSLDVQPPAPPRMTIFDHGHALFGADAGGGEQRLRDMRDRLGLSNRSAADDDHCLLGVIRADDHFEEWFGRIRALPDFYIEEVCRSAVGLGIKEGEAASAIEFLKHRRDNFRELIRRHRHEFRGISQWGLFS